MLSRMLTGFWIVALGVIVVFAFFAALGLFAPGEVMWLTAAMAVLAVMFMVHAIHVRHNLSTPDHQELLRSVNSLRERRGF